MSRLYVHVTPRSLRDAVHSVDASGVRVRVTAAPADGAANAAVAKLLSKVLGVPARDVVLVRGAASREKVFDIPLDERDVQERLRRAVSDRT
jgi:uncharacterized protein